MVPRKNDLGEGNTSNYLVWTHAMDATLVDAFLNQYNMGLKVNNTFVSKAYDNIVEELAKTINIKILKNQVKSRWKILKKHFSDAYDIFKNGMSGFTIDPMTQLWIAEPEVWDDLIKVKPQAKLYMQTPVPHYDKMVILYGKNRAIGNHSVTASELRKRSASTDVDDFTDSTHDIAPTMSQFSAQHVSHYVDDDMNIILRSPSEHVSLSPHGASGGNKKSRKTVHKEKKVAEGMKDAIEEVADAIRSSAELIAESIKTSNEVIARKAPISPTETYQTLLDLGFQPPLLYDIYYKLVMNVDLLNVVLGCPMEHRREFILSGILRDLRNLNM